MSTKQLAAAQTRSRLIEAAIRTLETHGTSGLTLDAVDPFSKQPDYKKCAARVVKKRPEAKAG